MKKIKKTLGMTALLLSMLNVQAFEPSDIAGLQIWLDADDTASVTLEADDKVSQWADLSGNDWHAVEASSGAQPVYVMEALQGRPVIRFAGSQSLQSSYNQLGVSGTAHSFFAVSHPEQETGYLVHAHGREASRDSQSFSVLYFSGGDLSIPIGGSYTETPYDAEPQIISSVWDRTAETAAKLLNGTVIDTGIGSSTSSNPLNIGKRDAGAEYTGDIAEIIVYDTALSVENRQTVEGYLAHKWGVTDALPETHPYKTSPPGDDGFVSALPFTLADIETGSTDFTNSNEVDLFDFPVPEDCDVFQITESGESGAIDPDGWEPADALPGRIDFTQPSADTNITLYAWFTNETATVALRRAEGGIYYTDVGAEPSILAALTRQLLPGESVVIMPAEIDDGSTGGEADGQVMAIHAMWLTLEGGPSTDATPEDPWVTVSELGDYTLSLTVMNEAGNVSSSTENCTLTVEAYDGQFTWTGAGDGIDWHDPLNWDAGGLPPAGESVVITNGATVRLTNATPELASLTMSGGVLTVAGWESAIRATNVTVSGGTIQPEGPFSEGDESRVLIECVDFYLGETAEIDGRYSGYLASEGSSGQGPGSALGARAGASHGGKGSPGYGPFWNVAAPYGSTNAPVLPGSGGYRDSQGGGAVRIDATGAVTIDGGIYVDGGGSGSSHRRGGSGGSIYISCHTITGDAGMLQARGGTADRSGGVGGGGRIAVAYDTNAQAALGVPDITFDTRAGTGGYGTDIYGENGTLWFPDMLFFESGVLDTRWRNVKIHVAESQTEAVFDSLQITGGNMAFPEIRRLRVDGDFTLSGDAQFSLYSGPTNQTSDQFGMQLDVGGELGILDNAQLWIAANVIDGAVAHIHCEILTVESDARIRADYRGHDSTRGNGYSGLGAGVEGINPGASHGGRSGILPEDTLIEAYGSAYAPILPGSGGGANRGGGIIWIGAEDTIRVDGTLSADVYRVRHRSFGPENLSNASGGSILLNANHVEGDGTLRAHGGDALDTEDGDNRGPGAGGRIAVWTPYVPPLMFVRMAQGRQQIVDLAVDLAHPNSEEVTITEWEGFSGTVSTRAGRYGLENAEHGTIVFGRILFGTLIKLR